MKNFIKLFIPEFLISFYHLLLAHLGAVLYGFPAKKMVVIGILGTRGKTTTANFIWSILRAAGKKAGLTGTANFRIGDEELLNRYHMTMPGRFAMQKLLKKMLVAGCEYAVIETPSEGVEQWRHKGIFYDIAVLTTLYPEYMAVHKWDYERCKEMHLKIFQELHRQPRKVIGGRRIPKAIVVNADNEEKNIFLEPPADRKITYGLQPGADLTAASVKIENGAVSFACGGEDYDLGVKGRFNVVNALGAIAVAEALGIEKRFIKEGLKNLLSVPGRMEKIDAGQNFDVFVDYAHDGPSIEATLNAVYETKKPDKKLISVVGAEGGGRDTKKRPFIGKLAAEKSDFVVVTTVDPYGDDPNKIIEDITAAAESAGKKRDTDLFAVLDRGEGIARALGLAKPGDTVLITGKGAEQSMIVGSKKIPWDDREIVRRELKKVV